MIHKNLCLTMYRREFLFFSISIVQGLRQVDFLNGFRYQSDKVYHVERRYLKNVLYSSTHRIHRRRAIFMLKSADFSFVMLFLTYRYSSIFRGANCSVESRGIAIFKKLLLANSRRNEFSSCTF